MDWFQLFGLMLSFCFTRGSFIAENVKDDHSIGYWRLHRRSVNGFLGSRIKYPLVVNRKLLSTVGFGNGLYSGRYRRGTRSDRKLEHHKVRRPECRCVPIPIPIPYPMCCGGGCNSGPAVCIHSCHHGHHSDCCHHDCHHCCHHDCHHHCCHPCCHHECCHHCCCPCHCCCRKYHDMMSKLSFYNNFLTLFGLGRKDAPGFLSAAAKQQKQLN